MHTQKTHLHPLFLIGWFDAGTTVHLPQSSQVAGADVVSLDAGWSQLARDNANTKAGRILVIV
jgi:hypothetical protein